MTAQEVFDKVMQGLAAQGFERSMNTLTNSCAYRGDEGRKCAAGLLIPDAEYAAEFEGRRFNVVIGAAGSVIDILQDEHLELILALQSAHDAGTSPTEMVENVRDVAVKYGLAFAETY